MKHTKHNYTIGIDLGDKAHETCTFNTEGEIMERSSVLNTKDDLLRFSSENKGAMSSRKFDSRSARPSWV